MKRSADPGKVTDTAPMPAFDEAEPSAASLIESLRGVGYSPATAISDLLDNSLSAGAGRVWVDMVFDGLTSRVTMLDDGRGMNEAELVSAMRPGSRSPLEQRAPSDLGRFGLGLKTASFSQCRRLTVASRKAGSELTVRRWDLDYVATENAWRLLRGPDSRTPSQLFAELDDLEHGTLVIWEVLDRLVPAGQADNRVTADRFHRISDEVERHLGMVFHRFLEPPLPSLRLYMNGRSERARIKPWDPFMRDHPATWSSPLEAVQSSGGKVEIQGHVLPHHDRLMAGDLKNGAGPEGWLAQQGFYVYRNRRMISAGGWLGLGESRGWTREEPYRLARLRVDVSNESDRAWQVDIKKSMVRPPEDLRQRLRDLADQVRWRARRVFAWRGRPEPGTTADTIHRVWTGSEGRYQIDRAHPFAREAIEGAKDSAVLEGLLTAIEVSVPVQRIWVDIAEARSLPSDVPEAEVPEHIRSAALALYRSFRLRGQLTADDARRRLARMEPFNRYPGMVNRLPNELDGEETSLA